MARGVCVKCGVRPARERSPRKKPEKNTSARAAAYDRPKTTECEECVRKRREQLAGKQPKDIPTLVEIINTPPKHKARTCIKQPRVRHAA